MKVQQPLLITMLILYIIHKLPCGLKCVHSLLGKQENNNNGPIT